MVGIPPIEMVMTGGWFMALLYPAIIGGSNKLIDVGSPMAFSQIGSVQADTSPAKKGVHSDIYTYKYVYIYIYTLIS